MAYTNEYCELIQKVYEFNKTLPEDKKIQFVGVDIEHQSNVAIRYIKSLVPEKEVPKEIKDFISTIKIMGRANYLEATKELEKNIKENEKIIKEYFGDDFFKLSLSIRNLSVSNGQMNREEYILSNFKEQYENLPKGKYFGQFGSYHTAKQGEVDINGYKPFAYYLDKEYEDTKGRVMTINYDYINSKCYSGNAGEVYDLYSSTIPQIFPKNGSTMLFKLNNEGSIFTKESIFVEEYPTTEYYDYIMMFSNSEAAVRYGSE